MSNDKRREHLWERFEYIQREFGTHFVIDEAARRILKLQDALREVKDETGWYFPSWNDDSDYGLAEDENDSVA